MMHVDYLSRNPVDDNHELKICALKTINPNKLDDTQTLREFQNNNDFCLEIFNNPDADPHYIVLNNTVVTKTNPPVFFTSGRTFAYDAIIP